MTAQRHNNPVRLERIVSGGQTGVDRGALDAALAADLPVGGWCPAGRRSEDGPIPERYPLAETASPRYGVRTRRNVRDADGTLVLYEGDLAGGTRLTAEYAAARRKPCLLVALDRPAAAPGRVADWLARHGIAVLNVAGPRESRVPGIHGRAQDFIRRLLLVLARRGRWQRFDRVVACVRELFPDPYRDGVYLVGGSVRDFLRDEAVRDIDLAAAVPERQLRQAGFYPVAARSSAPIWFRSDAAFGKVEVTVLACPEELADDLRRRDFTVNAMAMGLDGTLHDPLGGRGHLRRRRLVVCSGESFAADPLRIFRGFRFECDGWRLDRQAQGLIAAGDWEPALAAIPVERFSRELLDALGRAEPALFFRRMHLFGVGKLFLPELFSMAEIPAGPVQHHPEGDLLSHALQVLERVACRSGDPVARFCALFHDLGKLATAPELYPRHHGHDEAGAAMARTFCDRLRLPTALRTALTAACRLHMQVNNWRDLRDGTRLRIAEQALRAGVGEILPLLSAADRPGGEAPDGWSEALAVAALGADGLGVTPARLAEMAPQLRGDYLLQRRIQVYREMTGALQR